MLAKDKSKPRNMSNNDDDDNDELEDLNESTTFGRTADSLFRFLPRMANNSKPIFKMIKKVDKFAWDDKTKTTFANIKEALVFPLILHKP